MTLWAPVAGLRLIRLQAGLTGRLRYHDKDCDNGGKQSGKDTNPPELSAVFESSSYQAHSIHLFLVELAYHGLDLGVKLGNQP